MLLFIGPINWSMGVNLYSNSWHTGRLWGLGKFTFSIMIISTKAFFLFMVCETREIRHYEWKGIMFKFRKDLENVTMCIIQCFERNVPQNTMISQQYFFQIFFNKKVSYQRRVLMPTCMASFGKRYLLQVLLIVF